MNEEETLRQTLKEVLGLEQGQTLKEMLDVKLFEKLGIHDGEKVDLPKMARIMDYLLDCNSDAALHARYDNVVGVKAGPGEKVLQNNFATWTFLRDGDNLMAVSAAHCALNYKVKHQDFGFVEIPDELAGYVTSVGLLPGFRFGEIPFKTRDDIVVLYLHNQFLGWGGDWMNIVDEWKETVSIENFHGKMKVGGLAVAHSVRVSGLVRENDILPVCV